VDERDKVAVAAARLLYSGQHREYLPAKRQAAKRLGVASLPSNSQLRTELLKLAQSQKGYPERLQAMRRAALALMRPLKPFDPLLLGSVLEGHIRPGSDLDLHVFAPDVEVVCQQLHCGLEVRRVLTEGVEFVQVGLPDWHGYRVDITVYPPSFRARRPMCSITGEPIRRADAREVERLLAQGTASSPLPVEREELQSELGLSGKQLERVWTGLHSAYLAGEFETREEALALAAELSNA
jgi:hypothetical protein